MRANREEEEERESALLKVNLLTASSVTINTRLRLCIMSDGVLYMNDMSTPAFRPAGMSTKVTSTVTRREVVKQIWNNTHTTPASSEPLGEEEEEEPAPLPLPKKHSCSSSTTSPVVVSPPLKSVFIHSPVAARAVRK